MVLERGCVALSATPDGALSAASPTSSDSGLTRCHPACQPWNLSLVAMEMEMDSIDGRFELGVNVSVFSVSCGE